MPQQHHKANLPDPHILCLFDQGPPGWSTSEKEVAHNALEPRVFSLSAGCVLIYSFNKRSFALDLILGTEPGTKGR